jgi:hypothetical protein
LPGLVLAKVTWRRAVTRCVVVAWSGDRCE